MFFDDEVVRLPMTFPLGKIGTPTPGITHLEEPPERKLPPSRLLIPNTVVKAPIVAGDATSEPIITRTPYAYIGTLCRSIAVVQEQVAKLKTTLYELARAKEQKVPLPILMVHEAKAAKLVAEKYREAQRGYQRRYAMATLVTTESQLQIEGLTPTIAMIDTSASAIILGRSFARRMKK